MTAAFLFQAVVIPIVVFVAMAKPDSGRAFFRAADRALGRLGRRRVLSVVLIGLLSFAINASLGLFVREPVPAVHDEFAYLLGADTFAEGRLTNPTHPMWEHFETYHVIQHPTYQSKYPPGQSLFLALGQVVFGHPMWGVWISLALACGATCWMLQAWTPPRWALIGGLITVFNPLMTLHWGQSYWGGAVAMLGGALLFGALRRILRHQRPRDATILGVGLVVLAYSRPYEGLVASVPAALVLFGWLLTKNRPTLPRFVFRVALPTAAVLALGFAWLGFYHQRVTGDPLKMPYQVWLEDRGTDASVALGVATGTGVRAYVHNHAALHPPPDFEGPTALDAYLEQAAARETFRFQVFKLVQQMRFFIGIAAAIPFVLFVGVASFRRWDAFAACAMFAVVAATMLNMAAGFAHYSAPATALFVFGIVQGMRHIRRLRPGGRAMVDLLLMIIVVSALILIGIDWAPRAAIGSRPWSRQRHAMLEQLRLDPSDDLVLVFYEPDHNWHADWVYNAADIDAAEVVWARDLGPQKNAALIDFFREQSRRIWLLEADAEPPRLTPWNDADGHENPAAGGADSTATGTGDDKVE